MASKSASLSFLTNYQVQLLPNGKISIAKKFLDRQLLLAKLWSDPVRVLIEQDPRKKEMLEQIIVNPKDLPFELHVVSYKSITPACLLKDTAVVLTATGYKHNHISKTCKQVNVPCIYYLDYDLKTRKQIIAIETKNPLLRLRRNVWQDNQERKQLKAVAIADGVQCNGIPVYDAYSKANPNSLLYFTNNVTDSLLVRREEIEERTNYLCDYSKPLRLIFSGRLTKIKGADQLIDMAQELKQLGIEFHMSICGDGDLKETMLRRIIASDLSDRVKMMGTLSFKTELIPFVKQNVDLFVCCHQQGDPSSTYLETMSCGVPIVGYNNEAFSGLVRQSEVGWLVEINQPQLMAKKIAELSKQRELIKTMSYRALAFAKSHTFEKTYERRVAHIKQIVMNSRIGTKLGCL